MFSGINRTRPSNTQTLLGAIRLPLFEICDSNILTSEVIRPNSLLSAITKTF